MLEVNKHKFYLLQVLKDIYSDIELSTALGFKGGTALMFFYNLPRFSVDLDFDLLDTSKEAIVYKKLRNILIKYGTIDDEARKHYGLIIVIDYGQGNRKMKVEVSKRNLDSSYEIKNFLGIGMKVMVLSDMFSHKLCALTDRGTIVNRDIFDSWFFMNQHTTINSKIIQSRTKMGTIEYLQKCIETIESINTKKILDGLGELVDSNMKNFIRNKLCAETGQLLRFYQQLH